MNASIEERVLAGAAFLDEAEPGWEHRINLDTLDIAASLDCVLGQVYGDYAKGLPHLPAGPSLLGFICATGGGCHCECRVLTEAWRTLIAARRTTTIEKIKETVS